MNRRATTVVLAAAAVAVTACSSTTAGTPTGGGSRGASGGSGSGGSGGSGSGGASGGSGSGGGSPTARGSAPATPEGLAASLRAGLSATHSAHITLRVTTGGQSITGSGDETLADGKVSSLDLTETIPGAGTLRLIQVGGKTYVKLPKNLNTSAKPYTLVSPDTSNPTIKSLAGSLQSSQSSTAVDTAGVLASASRSITNRGPATVQGTPSTRYDLVVDVAKLPTDYSGRSALVAAGVSTLPISLYIDSSGRPVQVTEQLTVQGESVSTEFGVTKYNQPVTITAPPASQVASD